MANNFTRFGVMIDMSRNAVMNMDALKDFLLHLEKMGYNCVLLYCEDTYEVDGNPYFGYLRGRYSKAEMKEIDAFAAEHGIEVIPCIQTLAHLNAYLKWNKVPKDCNDILLTDDERTYKLIDDMIATLSECFTSRLIHIGMDEAHMLGRGQHLDIHGYETIDVLMKRHLARVNEIVRSYGFSPMMWSDMFFRGWNKGGYYTTKCEVPKSAKDAIPEGLIPVYWNYYSLKKESYDDMIYNHRQMADEVWFAGGAWCWSGLIPHNKYSLKTMLPAMDACKENKVENVFITLWGDDGAECSHFSQLPALLYIIEYAKGNTDEADIKKKFKALFGIEYDDFMEIDSPNAICGVQGTENPSKYMLYSDPFLGFYDYTVSDGVGAEYGRMAERLLDVAGKSEKYAYVFRSAADLCSVLSRKYELGIKTRKAYTENDKAALAALVEDYDFVISATEKFHTSFSYQWHKDNKPHGFDVQDLRIGGILLRLKSCKARLLAYLNGDIDKIDELEEKILPIGKAEGMPLRSNRYGDYASPNVISH
ncbi:MAG: beta-N-acetylhexosaminidase [Ruminococcaceae bacterium]|nr:beta-N-acetylhexosaminidase [Oscillospiraceae bacterium]